jgi:hypothetical protein
MMLLGAVTLGSCVTISSPTPLLFTRKTSSMPPCLPSFFENYSMNPVAIVPSNLLYSTANALHYTFVVSSAASTCANCSLRTKLMSPLETSTASRPLQRTLSSHTTHSLPCRDGSTPLNDAINRNRSDVVAYLRSIGAPA